MHTGNLFRITVATMAAVSFCCAPWISASPPPQEMEFRIGEGVATRLAISPKSDLVAIDAFDFQKAEKKIVLFDLKTQKKIAELNDGWGPTIQGLVFSGDGKYLVSVSGNALKQAKPIAIVKFWDILTGKVAKIVSANGLTLLMTEKLVVTHPSVSARDIAEVFDSQTGKQIASLKAGSKIAGAAGSHDGKQLAIHEDGGPVKVYELPSAKLLYTFSYPKYSLRRMMFFQNEPTLAVTLPGLTLLDMKTGEKDRGLGFFPARAISSDGKMMACLDMVGQPTEKGQKTFPFGLHILSREKKKIVATFNVDQKWQLRQMQFTPDNRALIAVGGGGIIRVWDVSKLQP